MEAINFILKKIEPEFKEAKIVEFRNNILSKAAELPAVMFYVQSQEDLDAVGGYYFKQLPHKRIFGFVIPFNKLGTNIIQLMKKVPQQEVTFMCDIHTEIFWEDDLRPEIMRFYESYNAIPQKLKNKIKKITSMPKLVDRIAAHKEFCEELIADKTLLLPLLSAYVNYQHGHQIDIISAFSPLIINKDHIDFVEECYLQTKKLFHSSINDLEASGRIVALYANFHTEFLAKKANITEFLKMIERVQPKALIFKFFNLEDIRHKKALKENYELLIRGIAGISKSLQIPTFYFRTHTAGYKALTKGIDVFAEPLNHNVEEKAFKMRGTYLKLLQEQNPSFKSGKIYDIKIRDLVSRKGFQDTRITETGIDSPLVNVVSYKPELITSMTDRNFRDFAKMVLMESRNYEMDELHKGIAKGGFKNIMNALSTWEGLDIPK